MPGQPGNNISVRYKVEGSFGAGGSGAGSEEFRCHAGAGLTMARGLIEDPEIRADGQRSMARLGGKTVTGTYPGTLSVGTFNTLLAALFRNTFAATAVKFTCDAGAAHTSLATSTANTLTLVGTDNFITTHGVRVGDVIRVGAMGAGVDNVNAVVATVAANVITVLGTPWTNIGADTNATFTIMKKLTNGATLTRSSYAFEEYFTDLDESELFVGCRVSSFKFTFSPNAIVKGEVGIVGQTESIIAAGASAPNFTSPTQYVSIGLVSVDALIFVAGAAIATVTGGELMFDLNAQGLEVVGSTSTPDVWEGPMKLTGQITAIRTLLTGSHLARYIAETDNVELSLMFIEPDAAVPIDFFHIFVPRLKYLGVSKNLGGDGPIIETIPFYAAAKATTTGYDSATATISTSA
jgi:hypothetical protein